MCPLKELLYPMLKISTAQKIEPSAQIPEAEKDYLLLFRGGKRENR